MTRTTIALGLTLTAALGLTVPRVFLLAIGAPRAVENGDTNGDGQRDITDAIYLISWLFEGGEAPVAIERASPPSLPSTGQSVCYDAAGRAIPCTDAAAPGQDGAYRDRCGDSAEPRFTASEATVTDGCTGLEWRRVTTGAPAVKWLEALATAGALILAADGTWVTDPAEAMQHGGVLHDDWRLPDAREIESIVDYGRAGPATSPAFAVDSAGYWTSTTFADQPDAAWCINFYDGATEPIPKVASLKVVVVRDAG
jgi:hypothetical protein